MANGLKNAFVIQAINAFVTGVILILLPFLMMDRGITIESMGLIFAVLPIVTQTNRVLFGIVSDYIGRKKFFWANSLMSIGFLGVYYFATTPLGFLLEKVSEGIRNASLWSVNRAFLIDHSKNEEKMLVNLRGLNSIFQALGTLIAGFLITLIFYENTLLLLIGVCLLLFPNVTFLKDKVKESLNTKDVIKALDFRHKGKKFKNFMGLFLILGLSWGLVTGYILPVFLKTMDFSTGDIGILLGIRVLFNGIAAYVFSLLLEGKKKVLFGGVLFAFSIALLSFSTAATIPVLIAVMGLVSGISDAGHEFIFVDLVDHDSLGRDIGILMIGTHLGIAISQALSGFVITSFGFPTMFFVAAMLYALFSLSAYYNLNGGL